MTNHRIFICRKIPYAGLEMLRDSCEIDMWENDLPPPRKVILEKAADIEGILTMLTDRIDAEFLDSAPNLKVVSNFAVGFDNLDIDELTRRRIPAGNTPGVLTDTTADFTFTLLLAAARRLPEAEHYVQDKHWDTWGPLLLLGVDLHHTTLGIVGMGRIGHAVARRAKGFEMNIIYHDTKRFPEIEEETGARKVDFQTLLKASDFITIHTGLNESTHDMFGREQFEKMKSSAILINTARGPIINSRDLYLALKNCVIRGAALDVTDPEPIPKDDPLLMLSNCLIVPHIASASLETRTKMALLAAGNILSGLSGEPLPNCINPDIYA